MISARKGEERVDAPPGGGGHGKNVWGASFPFWGHFSYVCRMCLHSLHVGAIFSMWGGGGGGEGVSFCMGGGGIFGLSPHNKFWGSPLLAHFLLHRYLLLVVNNLCQHPPPWLTTPLLALLSLSSKPPPPPPPQ